MGVVYGLVDPDTNELRYVGQTVQRLEKRVSQEIRAARRDEGYRWLAKCSGRPKIIILERDPADGMDSAEKRWIAHFRSLGCQLANGTTGGRGEYTDPERRSKAISQALTGRKLTPEHRQRISDGVAGHDRPHTEDTKRRISKTMRGRTLSPEHIKNLQIAAAKREQRKREVRDSRPGDGSSRRTST